MSPHAGQERWCPLPLVAGSLPRRPWFKGLCGLIGMNMFAEILRTACQLDPTQPVVVGVSGGADSLCLLDILHMEGYPLVVAHFNHKLRPEADREASVVVELARARHLPVVVAEAPAALWQQRAGHGVEALARQARYRFLFETARQHQAQAVAVGHTADDQVETILMHLLRGAGLEGLQGMAYRTVLPAFDPHIPLVRPLLSLWREQTEAHCRARGLPVQWDASNADVTYVRNRLRHQVLPLLQSFRPGVKRILLRTARLLQEEAALLDTLVEQAWNQAVRLQTDDEVIFVQERLASLPLALRRRLLRRAAQTLLGEAVSFDFEALQRAASFAEAPGARRLDWGRGLWLVRQGEDLLVRRTSAAQTGQRWPQVYQPITLQETQTDLGNGWKLTVEVKANLPTVLESDNWSVWLDADKVTGPLIVRPRRPGDRFRPLGMPGLMKVSDFFINVKLPQAARQGWPLVCMGEEIIWIPGFRPADTVRVTEKTQRVMRLSLHKV